MTNERRAIQTTHTEAIDLMGARMLVVATMGDRDDDIALIRSRMGPEPRLVPLHAHADVESFYVMDGHLDIFVDDAVPGWRTLGPGQSLTIPSGVRHAVRNASGAPVDSILATTIRIVRFFRDIATPPEDAPRGPPSAEDLARIRAKATEYGYWVATPESDAANP